jgi:hypothetical protein
MDIDLPPKYRVSDKPKRPERAKVRPNWPAVAIAAFSFALSVCVRLWWNAPAHDHSIVPPGAYVWTPEGGLKPVISGSPPEVPHH